MTIINLLTTMPRIELPQQLFGWLGFFLLFALLFWGVRRNYQGFNFTKTRNRVIGLALLIAVPLTSLLFGVQIQKAVSAPLPYLPNEASAPVVMLLFAIPWVLASGFLGTTPAVVLALLSGIFAALWQTHQLFTLVEIPLIALWFSVFIRQSYRTRSYQLMRHPILAAIGIGLLFCLLRLFTAFLETNGSAVVRLDYAVTQSWNTIFPRFVELLIVGGIAEVFYDLRVKDWFRPLKLIPSPTETSIQKRYFYAIVTFVAVLSVVLIVGQWISADKAARQMVVDRLQTSSDVAVQTLPYFFETGQSLSSSIADPALFTLLPQDVNLALAQQLKLAPFFRQLFLFSGSGDPVSGYPITSYEQIRPSDDREIAAIKLALDGIPHQILTISPWPGEDTAQISFISAVKTSDDQVLGVLIARTDIKSNPFTQQAVQALTSATKNGGMGMILDDENKILFHTAISSGMVMSAYEGELLAERELFNDTSPAGTRQLTYYQRAEGIPWSIVLSVPAQQAQQLALNLAIPLLGVLLLAIVVGLITIRFSLNRVTASLQKLADQTAQMSSGKLDTTINVAGEDEVGRLGVSFEKMRISLRARLNELNKLLSVSQGVAANLDVNDAVKPVLEAALNEHTNCVRAVLVSDVALDARGERYITFGAGPKSNDYAYLDTQLFELMRSQDVLPIPNTTRIRRLDMPVGKLQPGALIALPIYHENDYYGAFWIAYELPHNFAEEEVRFFTTLAGEVAMAAANSRLYTTAEIGRQRLEAVLASTPDPVLVFDNQERLFLLNPAALQVPGLVISPVIGDSIGDVVGKTDLLELLNSASEGNMITREVGLNMGRIYYASVSPVIIQALDGEDQNFGKICMLRDITHFKELDTLKSDFVATVSHDLRSPLTLMKGYSTMLQMVGELNEQQKSYVQKMVIGVDNMSKLVNNLLDLGRIEAGIDLKLETVNPADIVDQVINNLQLQATQKTITLLSESALKKPILIQADSALLQQALYNLVENAIKYTPVNGGVTVRLNHKNERVTFEIQDTGIGVAPLDLPRVFEKFYRSGRREAYQQKGTGLGLAIVKSVAERHGGRVWVESQLGKGSTFYLEIPGKHTS